MTTQLLQRITATGSRRQTGPLSGINVDNTAQFVLMPRLMECALPMLPPKLKNWWVECAGNVESVEAWRFAEMFLLADPEVRELVGGIDERLKADSETASQKSEMIYNSMTSQRGGSTTRRPLNSPFLACYLLPHVVDW